MDKKMLKKLIAISYLGKTLDEKKVKAIADRLTRKQLKIYLRALKMQEKRTTTYISFASETVTAKQKEQFENLFPQKKAVFSIDPRLLLGIRITSDDLVYDLNLQNSLTQMQTYTEEAL